MAGGGACADAVDPARDAREVCPRWLEEAPADWWVRALRGAGTDTALPRFDLWCVPGTKSLSLHRDELILCAQFPPHALRAALAGDVGDGTACECAVRWQAGLRGRLDSAGAQVRMLAGERPGAAPARGATRAGVLHLRALQAHDAASAGASQRDIAQALFGDAATLARWSADGELRAQVRHLLQRARAYVDGGYLALAGVTDGACPTGADMDPGDEACR